MDVPVFFAAGETRARARRYDLLESPRDFVRESNDFECESNGIG